MRKLRQIISAAILSVAFIGTAASAQTPPTSTTCDGSFTIINSGDNSTQTIDCTVNTTVEVTCTNNGAVINYTNQQGTSGNANVTGNNSGGTAVTGGVINSNSTTTDLNFNCPVVTSASSSASPSPSPSTTPGAKPAYAKPAVLPNTASVPAETVVIASLATAAFVVIASRVAVAAYRHLNVK